MLLVGLGATVGGVLAGGILGILLGLLLAGGDTSIHGGGGRVGLLLMGGAFAGLFVGLVCGLRVLRQMNMAGRNKDEQS